jgi:hypothetical protein
LKGEGENNAVLKEVMLSERFLTKLMNNHRNQINLEEEINRNMKGKFKLLGHIGLALFLVSALILALAPVAQAATAVTNVWVQFLADPWNTEGLATDFTIHFTPATALSRGVDTITVWFPDGSTAMGPAAFSLASTQTTAAYYEVDANGEATGDAVACTEAAVLSQSGYRITVVTPVDLAAGTACSLLIEDDAVVTCADDTSRSPYYMKVYTSQDTTPVASDAFDLDTTGPAGVVLDVSPDTAGSAGQYTFTMSLADKTELTAGVDTVTVIFPYGTTMPSSISADNVSCQNDTGNWENCTVTPVVNQKARTVTITTPITLSAAASQRVRFATSANIRNPQTATSYTNYYACTSKDELLVKETGGFVIDSNSATKIGFDNDAISHYSDSATMINMYSDVLYVQVQDTYGNLVDNLTTEPTVSFTSSHAGSGVFYSDNSGTQISSSATSSGAVSIYFKDTAAGTVTLTASADTYASGEWTITIAPGVSLYDGNDNLIKTFAPTSASPVAESSTVHSGDYIQNAIDAAVTGDTVKLGGTADAPAIYELDTVLSLSAKITLTSATGAAYTTLKPYSDALDAVKVTVTGTAANPVIIDGLTFTRLRAGYEFDQGVYNNGFNYVTVRNCAFEYIIPANEADHEYGSVVGFYSYSTEGGSGSADITSATISNNTFTNCCTFTTGAKSAVVNVFAKSADYTITGVTVSGNTLIDSNGYGLCIKGHPSNASYYVIADVTDNTVINGMSPISIQGNTGYGTSGVSVTGNTVTGGYMYGLKVESEQHLNLVIKNNTITGCAGATDYGLGALRIDADGGDTANTVQYNAIYDNDAQYSIYISASIGAQDCRYNYYGDATGPYYSALTGATVAKSNTGGTGKKVSDLVTYYPWLHKPLTDVVADNASYQASTMSLVSGWNTLSTPVKLIAAADSIDELIPAHMTIGYYYDATGWHQITTGYTLNACDAVYVKMSIATDVLLKFDASAWTTPSKDLAAGWNLVSLAYLSSSGKHADNAVASVANTAANLPGYSQVVSPSQNATQTDMYGTAGASWAYSSGETYASGQDMYAGLGYWVYMQNAATLAGFEITPIAPDLD